MDLVKIENKELTVKEWNGQRVVTAHDIANLHEREVKRVVENFQNNKEKFELGKDYFEITKEEIRKSKFSESFSKYSKNSIEILYTERGYLKLTKTFTDELSWRIQDMLVDSYFILKTVVNNQRRQYTEKELLLMQLKAIEKLEALEEENQVQKLLIGELQTVKQYVDTILESQDTMTITQIAADYGLSAYELNKILNETNIIRKVGGQWILYKEYMNKGYTKSETLQIPKKNGESKLVVNTKWTQKGRLFIHNLLESLGIKANMDRDKRA